MRLINGDKKNAKEWVATSQKASHTAASLMGTSSTPRGSLKGLLNNGRCAGHCCSKTQLQGRDVFMPLFIYWLVCLFIGLFVCFVGLHFYLLACLFVYWLACLFIYLLACLFIYSAAWAVFSLPVFFFLRAILFLCHFYRQKLTSYESSTGLFKLQCLY